MTPVTDVQVPARRRGLLRVLLHWWDVVEFMLSHWVPPRHMPGVLKMYMFFGFGWGAAAIASGLAGRLVIMQGPDLLLFPGGRIALIVWGALALLQATFILVPRPLGLYAFWAFHGCYVFLAMLYGILSTGVAWPPTEAAGGATVWSTLMVLYGWYRRGWFFSRGSVWYRPEGSCSKTPSAMG